IHGFHLHSRGLNPSPGPPPRPVCRPSRQFPGPAKPPQSHPKGQKWNPLTITGSSCPWSLSCTSQTDAGCPGESWEPHRTLAGHSRGRPCHIPTAPASLMQPSLRQDYLKLSLRNLDSQGWNVTVASPVLSGCSRTLTSSRRLILTAETMSFVASAVGWPATSRKCSTIPLRSAAGRDLTTSRFGAGKAITGITVDPVAFKAAFAAALPLAAGRTRVTSGTREPHPKRVAVAVDGSLVEVR